MSDREQLFIEVTYDRIVTGNLERARQTCMSSAQTYPRDPEAHALASGLILQGLADFDISIEEARKALALDPDLFPAYTNLAYSYFLEGQMKQATNVVAEAEGISEFQKVVDHPGIRFTDPIGSLAYLQISRGYRLLGDQINARGAYETFSKRWLDADPDVPILQEAQREFQALR